ncbi:hypothetical protein KP509_1Z080300 [Ceratopteris richardii]|nr:hypothetical protein KP509_1Z080300 [Ceratopteris richardii]
MYENTTAIFMQVNHTSSICCRYLCILLLLKFKGLSLSWSSSSSSVCRREHKALRCLNRQDLIQDLKKAINYGMFKSPYEVEKLKSNVLVQAVY